MLDITFGMNRLREIREECGLTLEEVAEHASTTLSTIQRFETGTRNVSLKWLEKLAKIYNVAVQDLVATTERNSYKKSIMKPLQTSTTWGSELKDRSTSELIPLYGRANGSGDRMIMHPDNEIGRVQEHPAQDGYKRELKFAMEIVGSSMEPMMSEGDTAYAILNQSPQKEKPCIVECDEEALVKLFIKKSDKEITLRQFNPRKDIKVPLSKIKSLHAIKGVKFRGA